MQDIKNKMEYKSLYKKNGNDCVQLTDLFLFQILKQ